MTDLRQRHPDLLDTMEAQILAKLDFEHLTEAVEHVVFSLGSHGAARAIISPGDATRYDIVITSNQHAWGDLREAREDYLLTYVGGASYPWDGSPLHWDYVTDKWVPDGRKWTGIVLAQFLSMVSARLKGR